jgi:hypothetical protein
MRRPRLVAPQIGGIAVLLLAAIGAFGFGLWGWTLYRDEMMSLASSNYSVAIVIGLLTCIYLVVVLARVVHEPQYAYYVQGRIQEAMFLGNYQLIVKAAVAVGAVVLNSVMEGLSLPTGIFAWGAFLFAAASFIKDISGAWLRPVQREEHFFVDPSSNPEQASLATEAAISIQPPAIEVAMGARRFSVPDDRWTLYAGSLMNVEVNRALQDPDSALSRASLTRAGSRYALPEKLQGFREAALIHARAGGGLLYNEQKIRLTTDLDTLLDKASGASVKIQQTSYFDFICSNGLTRFLVAQRDTEPGKATDMFTYLRNSVTGRTVPLASSMLSNHLGGGTLAITRSGKLLASKQGRLSLVATGLLAPTGSGSFDWADQRGVDTLTTLVVRGLERELLEECDYEPRDLLGTQVLGFARDLRRGGKPDFYAVTLVEGEPSVGRTEVGFIDQHEAFDLDATSVPALVARLMQIAEQAKGRSSAALLANLHMLVHARPEIHASICAHIHA